MSEAPLVINILTFNAPAEHIEFQLFKEKIIGSYPLTKYEYPFSLHDDYGDEIQSYDKLYCTFDNNVLGDYKTCIDLNVARGFAIHYFNFKIREYFTGTAYIVYPNFINDTEVWILSNTESSTIFNAYGKYSLKVQSKKVSDSFEIVLSYEGLSKILTKSIQDLSTIDPGLFSWLKFRNELIRFNNLTEDQKQHIGELFPLINNNLRKVLGIALEENKKKNKFISTLRLLKAFYSQYLDIPEFKNVIDLTSDGFITVPETRILKTASKSNQMLFYNGETDIEPYAGMNKYGPYQAPPSSIGLVKFFFIYPSSEKTTTVYKLYKIFENGMYNGDRQIFKSLNGFIKQPFSIEKEDSIPFDNVNTLIDLVNTTLRTKDFKPNTKYVAIYISPISKDVQDAQEKNIYFKLKELLLKYQITSQVIYKESINKPAFNFYLPNIAIALLGKLEGIPWRLNRDQKEDLIVGIGAFYSATEKHRYIGSAFCFDNKGIFKEFDCFPSDQTDMLAGSIRQAVMRYIIAHEKAERLIIHYYKVMSDRELYPITDILYKLGLKIPVIIITINKTESKDLVAFDTSAADLMPVSGTIIATGYMQYLLFNNTKYGPEKNVKDWPFPIKLAFTSTEPDVLKNTPLIKELIDQIYQFSRMYWKSVKQQNLPVTIKYPEMVAEIFSHFESDVIPPFGKNNLWFL